MRDLLVKIIDVLDPPPTRSKAVAPCPSCGNDLWRHNIVFRVDPDLTFVKCVCGSASGWLVEDGLPRLAISDTPVEFGDF